MKLIVQIPAFNEEATIAQTLRDIPKRVDGVTSIETLVIDDGSSDDTAAAARKAGATHVVQLKSHRGLSSAFLAGIDAALRLGAPVVEFHTGRYAQVEGDARTAELKRIADCAALATKNAIESHAGHGLTFDNVAPIAAIPQLAELNIGHFLVGEAIFTGLEASVTRMRELMDAAR